MKRTTGKQMSLPSWQIKERLFPRTCARSTRLFSPSLYCPGGSSSHRVPATWRLQLSPSPCHLEAPVLTNSLPPGGSSSHQLPATWRLQFSPTPCHLEAPVLTKSLPPGGSSSHQVPVTWRLQFSPSPCHLEAPALTKSLPPGGSSSHKSWRVQFRS